MSSLVKEVNWDSFEYCIGTFETNNNIERSRKRSIVVAMICGEYDEEIVKAYEKKEKESK